MLEVEVVDLAMEAQVLQRVELAAVVMGEEILLVLLELLILEVAEAVVDFQQALVLQAVLAVQASSLFHTQAQHNYLVVELLPNQAVTSFTHSHLLAHLALCHL
jgi:hypothetical protein